MHIDSRDTRRSRATSVAALGCAAVVATHSFGQVDLTVNAIEVNQAINNNNSLTLVARNATIVRVRVGVAGSTQAVPNVDAELRVFANGVEIPGSPFFSSNGPITAPVSPSSANENDTLNFFCVPPQSADVDFVVVVNPLRTVVESNYANNEGSTLNRNFVCRKMVELAYVSVNYTPSGGQPLQNLIEPGVGDAFLRGIFKTGDWNYHRSPLGVLTWTQNINSSNNALLNTINDIRNVQIPAAGFSKPEFIYAWLPGNPFSGNGQAIGVPGAAAFGNTELNRFQRTFAHEIGHLWGQQHNSATAGSVGYDVVNGLRDPLNLPPLMPSNRSDVMVAGLLTNQAWVAPVTFNDCINDARSACTSVTGGDDGGDGASDFEPGVRSLRFAGEYDHVRGRIDLMPALRLDVAEPTVDDPSGDALVKVFARNGRLLSTVRMRTGTARECCATGRPLDRTPFYAIVPETILGQEIGRIEIRDIASGTTLARQIRSANAPTAAITGIGLAQAEGAAPAAGGARPPLVVDPAEVLDGDVELRWVASDADGDALVATLLYSPDAGMSWVPVAVHEKADPTGGENSIRFSTRNIPRSEGPTGVFKLRVSDDLNQSDAEFPVMMSMGAGTPPDVHVISPNTGITIRQHSSLVLQASGWDIDDELLPESALVWSSNLDGVLGSGRLFTTRALRPGTHVLTLVGTDSDGMSSSRTVTVTVTARNVRSADLNFDGDIDAADLAILLGAWGTDSAADLDLDGAVGGSDIAILLGAWQ
jgi:hypothetical protein